MLLKVSIGPSYTDVEIAHVNDASRPTFVKSKGFEGWILVRIKDFNGVTPNGEHPKSSDESYFGETRDTSSVQFSGKIDGGIDADEILFGNDFDEPIRDSLPMGTSLGLRALKIIDPCLESDLYCEKPWAFSPLLATVNLLNLSHQAPQAKMDRLSEDTTLLLGEPINATERRKYFALADNRKKTRLEGFSLSCDFSNPFIDFNNLAIKMPYVGLHFDILQYWKGQKFRYTCKSRSNSVYFVVVFELVDDRTGHNNSNSVDSVDSDRIGA